MCLNSSAFRTIGSNYNKLNQKNRLKFFSRIGKERSEMIEIGVSP